MEQMDRLPLLVCVAVSLSNPADFCAVDAIRAAKDGHVFLSVTKHGICAIVESNGNPATHVILRGSNKGPNYSSTHVKEVVAQLKKANLPQRVMIDCSHGNSEKNHENQPKVAADVAAQLANPETAHNILGVMIESNLVAGSFCLAASFSNRF
jgi:3-deoxy-7-phosphoheptulonate synthase